MTVQEYLKEKTELFFRSGVPEAENEAWVVLETVSGLTRSSIRFSFAKELAEVVSDEVFSSLEKTYELRACGEPLAYIVGHAPFYDLEFSVGEGVLIPRFDTEILVETALKALGVDDFPFPDTDGPVPQVNATTPFIIYDLCTGSGCIGITIAHELLKRSIPCCLLMTDISEEAASYAKKNAQEILGTKVSWEVQIADLWPDGGSEKGSAAAGSSSAAVFWGAESEEHAKSATDAEKFAVADAREDARAAYDEPVGSKKNGPRADLIVANPPYITKDEMDDLSVEVGKHEPHLALTDGGDGLSFYKRIFAGLPQYLKDGGAFAVEHGYLQKENIRRIMPEYITDVVSVKDYGDNDRVTCGRYEAGPADRLDMERGTADCLDMERGTADCVSEDRKGRQGTAERETE